MHMGIVKTWKDKNKKETASRKSWRDPIELTGIKFFTVEATNSGLGFVLQKLINLKLSWMSCHCMWASEKYGQVVL